ncbi:MAG TPA: RNA 2',3'-cyclic phosphodiesterase [Ignavibacteria bacterium]|nr:RNA 2',3'-cyclic phosphodiesterase [Ignavibacteria bacterium]
MRTFISINISESIKNITEKIQQKFKSDISQADHNLLRSVKWESKNKFHITLYFIGDLNDFKLKEIDHELSDLSSKLNLNEISFELGNINAFPDLKNPRVLMIELLNEDKKLIELSRKINSSFLKLGYENDKPFHPHITLGRIKRDRKIDLSGLKTELNSGVKFSVNEFYLMESKLTKEGSEYSVLKKFSL